MVFSNIAIALLAAAISHVVFLVGIGEFPSYYTGRIGLLHPVLITIVAAGLIGVVISTEFRWSALVGSLTGVFIASWKDRTEALVWLPLAAVVAFGAQAVTSRIRPTHYKIAFSFGAVGCAYLSVYPVRAWAFYADEQWRQGQLAGQIPQIQDMADLLVQPEYQVKLSPDPNPNWVEPWENAILTGEGKALRMGVIVRANGYLTILVDPRKLDELSLVLSPEAKRRSPFGPFGDVRRTDTGILATLKQPIETRPWILRGPSLMAYD